jgi:hypothetical protein
VPPGFRSGLRSQGAFATSSVCDRTEIRTYTGADALALLHQELAECLLCTLISGANRKIRVEPEKTPYVN